MQQEPIDIVLKTLEEHKYIDENVGKVENSLSDINALALLERERSSFALMSQPELASKISVLKNSLSYLSENLKKHFSFEEGYLLKLLDKNIVQEIAGEHVKMSLEFDKIGNLIEKFKPEKLAQEEFLKKKTEIVAEVNNLCRLIQEHAMKEDRILRAMKKDLESKQKR